MRSFRRILNVRLMSPRRLVAELRPGQACRAPRQQRSDGMTAIGYPFAAGKRTALEAAAAGVHRMVSRRKSAGGRYGSE